MLNFCGNVSSNLKVKAARDRNGKSQAFQPDWSGFMGYLSLSSTRRSAKGRRPKSKRRVRETWGGLYLRRIVHSLGNCKQCGGLQKLLNLTFTNLILRLPIVLALYDTRLNTSSASSLYLPSLSLPMTTGPPFGLLSGKHPLIWSSTREQSGALRLAYEWRFRSFEITVTITIILQSVLPSSSIEVQILSCSPDCLPNTYTLPQCDNIPSSLCELGIFYSFPVGELVDRRCVSKVNVAAEVTEHSMMQDSTIHHITLQHSTMQHVMMQHSTMQHSMMQHITMQHSTIQHSTIHHSTLQHTTMRRSTMQHRTLQHSAMQHSTTQHSTIHHNTLQHSTMQHSMTQHSTMRRSTMQPSTMQ